MRFVHPQTNQLGGISQTDGMSLNVITRHSLINVNVFRFVILLDEETLILQLDVCDRRIRLHGNNLLT